MLKSYKNELIVLATIFAFIGYGINLAMAAPKQTAKEIVVTAKKETAKPAKKEASKPAKKTEEPKKDPNRKKPTLKKKFQK